MGINTLKFKESDLVGKTISELPDQVTGQAAMLKARFDEIGKNQLALGRFNDLIDALLTATDGDSGADNIGATAIGTSGETVQSILEYLQENKINKSDITHSMGVDTEKVVSQKGLTDALATTGNGDMLKIIYDENGDGIVDNASRLGGKLPGEYVAKNDDGSITVSGGVTASGNIETSGNVETSGGIKISAAPSAVIGKNYAGDEMVLIRSGANAGDNLWIGTRSEYQTEPSHTGKTYISAGQGGKINAVIKSADAEGEIYEMLHRGNICKQLWSGSWSSGAITVPNLQTYHLYAVTFDGAGTVALTYRYGSWFRGIGGYISASGYLYTYHVSAQISGNSLTLTKQSAEMSHNPSASHGAINNYVIDNIYGLL